MSNFQKFTVVAKTVVLFTIAVILVFIITQIQRSLRAFKDDLEFLNQNVIQFKITGKGDDEGVSTFFSIH